MPLIQELLHRDHNRVKKLFKDFEKAEDAKTMRPIRVHESMKVAFGRFSVKVIIRFCSSFHEFFTNPPSIITEVT